MMPVCIPCDEKFIRQYYRGLGNHENLLNCLDLLLGYKFHELATIVAEHTGKADEEYNYLLLSSFFSKDGESESEFFNRYEHVINYTARLGNPISQFALAERYEDDEDKDNAFKYYQLSSEKQFAPSLTNAGIKLIYGVGCTIDAKKGLNYLNQAKNLEDDIAKEFLECYSKTTKTTKTKGSANLIE